ncbi:IPT/TIG domain-containing protein [Streptomyces sp. NPDC047108]|uniref:IPT/TIG domain-containing protein n=1 Tax=Streptomyces sp. NPDC047108 TaxID=3155025 RepID=UPI0033F12E9C
MSGAVQQQGSMASAGNALTAAQGDWPGDWPGDGGGNWPRNPRLYDINPNSGSTAGGNTVVLTGANLQGTFQVTFGGTPATNVTPNQYGNSVTVTAPPHAAGAVSVVATTPYGTTNALSYTYIAVPVGPTVSALVPNTGPTAGGTAFAIIGTNLTGASVTFNGVSATGVSINGTGTVLTGTTPAGPAGNVPVVVTTPLGSTTVAGGFTYVAPPPLPVATAITPTSGTAAGGTAFVITGSNLNGASVTFNGVAATGVSVNPAGTALVGFTPAGAVGLATVVVTTAFGTATVPGGYTYTAPPLPVATAITPTSGTAAGGTAFVITGSNLNGASVTFNGVAATGLSVNPAGTAIIGFTPAGMAGPATVAVTTLGGSTTVAGGYTYV